MTRLECVVFCRRCNRMRVHRGQLLCGECLAEMAQDWPEVDR